ncbi:MAG: uridylate kinase [Parcubacteria group bacterium Licking1014_1]|nr:MAG: uridylate kinase [Parcubacteria group bacterium Licking1014_1]
MISKKETIIISLGGSLVAPNEIDIGFLKNFRHCLQKYAKRFFIFVGGGKIARNYQKALLEFDAKNTERDWIGIGVSKLNAELVRQLFVGYSYNKIITDPTKKIKTNNDIMVGAGWKPGWSTDYVSVLAAKTYGIKTVINLTNVDYVYDKNPNIFPDAKPIREINWLDFRKIVGDKWSPGLSMPFDPRASKIAEKLKLKIVMINGKNLKQLENFLNNKPFIGTTIN